jgi:hypothetical protein
VISILAVSYDNPGDISPGVLGFIVVAALAVALFFLLRSMNRHLRRVSSARDEGRELGTRADDDRLGISGADAAGGPAGSAATRGVATKKPNGSAGS